jgi:hypothetical protein
MELGARIPDFENFWPFYVGQHRRPGTRYLHFLGTTLALLLVGAAIATHHAYLYAWAVLSGYGFAWIGHFFIEKNRPATFQYPLWSFRGDFRMYALMWRGKMTAETARLGATAIALPASS